MEVIYLRTEYFKKVKENLIDKIDFPFQFTFEGKKYINLDHQIEQIITHSYLKGIEKGSGKSYFTKLSDSVFIPDENFKEHTDEIDNIKKEIWH